MSMIKRATTTGHIEEFTEQNDEAVLCKACSRIIVSKVNLLPEEKCPFCHNSVNDVLASEELISNVPPDIAEPC